MEVCSFFISQLIILYGTGILHTKINSNIQKYYTAHYSASTRSKLAPKKIKATSKEVVS
jgi:hypothetical protein